MFSNIPAMMMLMLCLVCSLCQGQVNKALIIGPTGVGKSSLVNALYRYQFASDDSLIHVHQQTDIGQDIYRQVDIFLHPEIYPAHLEAAHASATNRICHYRWPIGDRLIELIDTPGFDDTHGIEVQRQINSAFQETLRQQGHKIDQIILVLNGTETRHRPGLVAVWQALKQSLPTSVTGSVNLLINFSDFTTEERDRIAALLQVTCGMKPKHIFQVNFAYLIHEDHADYRQQSHDALARLLDTTDTQESKRDLQQDQQWLQWMQMHTPDCVDFIKAIDRATQLAATRAAIDQQLQATQADLASLGEHTAMMRPQVDEKYLTQAKVTFAKETRQTDAAYWQQAVTYRQKTIAIDSLWRRLGKIPVLSHALAPYQPVISMLYPESQHSHITYQVADVAEHIAQTTIDLPIASPTAETCTQVLSPVTADTVSNPLIAHTCARQQQLIDTYQQQLAQIEMNVRKQQQQVASKSKAITDCIENQRQHMDIPVDELIAQWLPMIFAWDQSYFASKAHREPVKGLITALFASKKSECSTQSHPFFSNTTES